MTIEEKAKAYDRALECIQEILNSGSDSIKMSRLKLRLQPFFHELAESEDEKIRKVLVDLVKCNERSGYTLLNNVSTSSMLAWLEKQKYTQKDVDDAWLKGMCDAKQELEKQGEQKPADKVEQKCEESKTKIFDAPTPFEDKLYVFVAACEFLAIPSKIEFILEHSQEILDAAREQIGKEQKPAWSEEDERKIQDCIDAVSRVNLFRVYYQNELVGWLKSLKAKVQPKQEWSEKDEEELEIAIDTLKESGRYDSAKWVQSLKQRIGG